MSAAPASPEVPKLESATPKKVAQAYKALHVAMPAKMSNASILVCQGHMSMTFEVGSLWSLCPLKGVGVGVAGAYRALHVAR